MSIIRSCKAIILTIILVFLLVNISLWGQDTTKHKIRLLTSVGASFNLSGLDNLPAEARKSGFAGTLIVQWQPEHRLSVGLETGILFLSKIEKENVTTQFGKTSLYSLWQCVPILVTFGMRFGDRFTVYGAFGYYDVIAVNKSFENTVATSQLNAGLATAFEYYVPLNSKISLGIRFAYHNISELEQNLVTSQVSCRYALFEW